MKNFFDKTSDFLSNLIDYLAVAVGILFFGCRIIFMLVSTFLNVIIKLICTYRKFVNHLTNY